MGFGLGLRKKADKLISVFRYSFRVVGNKLDDEAKVLLLCHALEKGMGIPNSRLGYGREKARTLIIILKKMQNEGKTGVYAFQEGVSVLDAYFECQRSNNVDVSELTAMADPLLKDYKHQYKGGYESLNNSALIKGTSFDFEAFSKSRHSMRAYSNAVITKDEVIRAVSIAKRAPSACNRQPWKFYTVLEKTKIDQIKQCIPNQSFLDGVPYFGIVTVEHSMFDQHESFQWFINGGIFVGFLVLAFHQVGIGSCILQYPVMYQSEKELRATLLIPDNEAIIAAVAFGHYPEQAKCIMADRKTTDEIVIFR